LSVVSVVCCQVEISA